jgi:hypothetical protein
VVRVADAAGAVVVTPVGVVEGTPVVGGGCVGASVGDGVPVDGRALDDGDSDGGTEACGVGDPEGSDPAAAGDAVAVGGPGVGAGRAPPPAMTGGASPGPVPT